MDPGKARHIMNHVHKPVLISLAYVNLSSSRYLGDKEAASSSEAFIIIKKKFTQGSYPSRCQDTLHLPAWWRQCAVLQRQKSLHIAQLYGLVFTTAAAADTRVSLLKFFTRRRTQDSRSKSTSTPARREGTKVNLQ